MSRRHRHKERLDYKEFHRTGRKGFKGSTIESSDLLESMASPLVKLKRNEKSLGLSTSEFLRENVLAIFDDVEDVDNCLQEIKSIRDNYRIVHVDLESEIGEEYKDIHYEAYTDNIEKIGKYIFVANSKKKELRLEKENKQYEREKQERFEIEERQRLIREEKENRKKEEQIQKEIRLREEREKENRRKGGKTNARE